MGRTKGSKNHTSDEVMVWADYIINTGASLGTAGNQFGIDRRVIWLHFKNTLEWHDPERYKKVREVLDKNRRGPGKPKKDIDITTKV